MHRIANGMQQMGLAQSHAAIQEERIIGLGRVFCHCQGGGMRQAVARSNHKILKGIAAVER